MEQGDQLVAVTTGYSFTGPDGIIHSTLRVLLTLLRDMDRMDVSLISDSQNENQWMICDIVYFLCAENGSLTVQQVAAFFDMDESALRVFDETWGVSALMKTLGLNGMYVMGAVVLIGGFGWIHIGENIHKCNSLGS